MKKQHRSPPFKLLSLLLALAMLFCMIPVSAVALESETAITETAQVPSASPSQGESSAEEILGESAPEEALGLGELSTEVLATMEVNAEDIPEVIPMARAQEKGLVNRLYAQEESLSTVLFQTKSGSKTAYVFGKPVKYVDANGVVRDKSTAITGILNTTYAYGMLDNNVKVYFPRNITSGVLLSYNDYSITMSPEVSGDFTATYAQEENTVAYAGVFGERTILAYTPTLYGVKEDIILVSYTGKNSFDFIMEQQGLTAVQNDGGWQLVNAADQVVAGLGSVIVKDSAGKTAMGELTLTPLAGGKYRVTVTAPEDFLTAEDTVYPVYVDPTTTIYEEEYRDTDDLLEVNVDTIIDVGLYQGYDDYYSAITHPERHMLGLGMDYCRVIYKFYDFYGEYGWFTDLSDNQIGSVTLHVNAYNTDPITATAVPMTATWSPYEGENPIALWDPDEVNLWDEINTTHGTTTIDITSNGSYEIDVTQIAKGWARFNQGVSTEDYHNPENGFCLTSTSHEYVNLQSVEVSDYNNVYYEVDYSFYGGEYYVATDVSNHGYYFMEKGTPVNDKYYLIGKSYAYASPEKSRWLIDYQGNNTFYIRLASDTTYALCDSEGAYVDELDANNLNYKWSITPSSGEDFVYIQNQGSGNYLSYADGIVCTSPNMSSVFWRIKRVSEFLELTSFTSSLNWVGVNSSKTFSGVSIPSDATWDSVQDFIWQSSDSTIATVSNTGRINGIQNGSVKITAIHKVTNNRFSFYVSVGQIFETSDYYIMNKLKGKYLDITGGSMDEGALLKVSPIHDYAYEKWSVEYVSNGYYKIRSLHSSKFMALSSASSNPNISSNIVQKGTLSDMALWKIVKTADGAYKLIPKANENSGRVLATITSSSTDSCVATNNVSSTSPERGEWYFSRCDQRINVQVTMDNGYVSRYTDEDTARERIEANLFVVREKYAEYFEICLAYSTPTNIPSYADGCNSGGGSYNAECDHCSETECKDSIIGEKLEDLHHKNLTNIMARFDFPDISQNTLLAFIGHVTCSGVNGMAHKLTGITAITNFISEKQEIKTTMHELGHLFYAPDHYGNGTPSTLEKNNEPGSSGLFNQYCIYGEKRNIPSVFNNLTICEGCRALIQTNADRFRH